MTACGQANPTDEDQAADFIDKLDNARYSEFKANLRNNNTLGVGTYPKDLADAFKVASKYVVAASTKRQQSTTVFNEAVFTAQSKSENVHSRQHGGRKQFQPKTSEKKPERKQSGEGKKQKPCHLCGKLGHYMLDCKLLQECKEILAERKAGDAEEISALHLVDQGAHDIDSVVLVNEKRGRGRLRAI